jgi:hypothetical protein
MSRRALLLVVALLAAAHAASFLGYGPCDDDFITYRYARNLVEGQGLVFNPGERVEGFSAPGWTLLVALALKLGLAAPTFSLIVSIAASAVAAFAVGSLWSRRHDGERFNVPALLVAASPAIAFHAVVGLGTVLQAALLALWLDLWDRALRNSRGALSAAIVLGLAALVRNESILFAVPFVAIEARAGRWRSAWPAFAPLVAWQILRVNYYERWTPITYAVKKLALLDDVKLGLEYLAVSTGSTGIALAVVLAILVIAKRRESIDAALRAAALGCAAYVVLVVYVGGDFMELARFFVPILPIALLLACEAVSALVVDQPRAGAALACLALLLEQVPQRSRAVLRSDYEGITVRGGAIGRELGKRLPASTKVAVSPIGALGYESRLYVVDMLGLTNTAVANAPPNTSIAIKGHQRFDAEWVLAQQPEVILLGSAATQTPDGASAPLVVNGWERPLLENARFAAEYEPLSLDVEGSYPVLFFWRRDLAPPGGARKQ